MNTCPDLENEGPEDWGWSEAGVKADRGFGHGQSFFVAPGSRQDDAFEELGQSRPEGVFVFGRDAGQLAGVVYAIVGATAINCEKAIVVERVGQAVWVVERAGD